jgi:hypothetical protein
LKNLRESSPCIFNESLLNTAESPNRAQSDREENPMKLTLYAILGYVSFICGSTIDCRCRRGEWIGAMAIVKLAGT